MQSLAGEISRTEGVGAALDTAWVYTDSLVSVEDMTEQGLAMYEAEAGAPAAEEWEPETESGGTADRSEDTGAEEKASLSTSVLILKDADYETWLSRQGMDTAGTGVKDFPSVMAYDRTQSYDAAADRYQSFRILENENAEITLLLTCLLYTSDLKLLDEAMMALIVFKNLYPKDFADIQLEKGIIKKAFVDKENYINNIHLSTHREIAEKEDTIKAYKNEHIKEIKELKLIMLTALASWKGIVYKIDAYQSSFNTDNILNDSFDLSSLGNVENCTIRFTTWNNANSNARVDSCKNILSPYMKRIELLQRVHEKGILHLKEEIEQKQKEEHEISRWTLKKLLERFGVDEVLSEEVRQNSLLVFLLRRGYIDETYTSYINYFKGTSITKGDMNFILAIKNEEQLSFNYQLSKVDMVVKQLQLYEFEQKAIYNFNLLDYLLSNPSEREKMEVFLRQLSDGTEKSWKFIDEFVDCTENRGTFIRLLSGTWYGLWDAVSNLSLIHI